MSLGHSQYIPTHPHFGYSTRYNTHLHLGSLNTTHNIGLGYNWTNIRPWRLQSSETESTSLCFSPNGRMLFGKGEGSILQWDTITPKCILLSRLKGGARVHSPSLLMGGSSSRGVGITVSPSGPFDKDRKDGETGSKKRNKCIFTSHFGWFLTAPPLCRAIDHPPIGRRVV